MKKIRNSLPHVAVLLKSAYLTNRELLKGLLKYTRIEEPWTLTIKTGRADEPREIDFEAIRCAGIVADQPDEAILGYAHRRHIPVITILQDKQVSTDVVADVTCDNASVARLAADHLVATGFTHFAYVGERADAAWSRARYKAFRDALRERGVTDVADEPEGSARLADFLANLQKPCGLFVANDTRAVDVLRAAAEVDVSIPDEIGLVSVDNDDILCETSLPALSSIPWDTEKTGYEMARFLNEAIASSKRRQTFRTIYYRATAVVSRQSSAHILSSDALVRKCHALMELNFASDLNVDDLAHRLYVSRRTLERRFLAATGKPVASALQALRMAKAENLIRTTEQPLADIAVLCGFCDASHLGKTFKRHAGVTPSSLRSKRLTSRRLTGAREPRYSAAAGRPASRSSARG